MHRNNFEVNVQENQTRYVGVYANGMQEAVFSELQILNYFVEKHYQSHNIIVFTAGKEIAPMCLVDIFQLVGEPGVKGYHYEPVIQIDPSSSKWETKKRTNNFKKKHLLKDERAITEARQILLGHISSYCDEYFPHLNRPWRIACDKQGNHAFSGGDICQLFGDIAQNEFRRARENGLEISRVSLKHSEVEIVILISNVFIQCSTSPDNSERGKFSSECDQAEKNVDLWFFGLRKTPGHSSIDTSMPNTIEPKSKQHTNLHSDNDMSETCIKNRPSSTGNSIAACLSMLVLSRYLSGCDNIIFLDPMCGLGTIPMVFRELCNTAGKNCFVIGTDTSPHSLSIGNQKSPNTKYLGIRDIATEDKLLWADRPNIILADTTRLPFLSNLFDVIIVDPPWGHRHGKNHVIMKNMFRWMKEWVRVLKIGGILGMMTIRSNQVMHEYKSHFDNGRGLELIDCLQFENSGMCQCCFFTFRKRVDKLQ